MSDISTADRALRPALDVVTERAGVIMQNRPVVSLSAWLTDAMKWLAESHRHLYLVTPHTSRLTALTRFMLLPGASRWVVDEPTGGGHYDGIAGTKLTWNGEMYEPVTNDDGTPVLSPSFTERQDQGLQLVLNLHVRHAATATAELGGACSTLASALTSTALAGWGTAEPISQPWREADLTAFARQRAPQPSWLAVRGGGDRPLVGSVEVHRVPDGLDEFVTLGIGYRAGEQLPLDLLAEVADELVAAHQVVTMLVQALPGLPDVTYAPYWNGLPWPLILVAGYEALAQVGFAEALAAPDGVFAMGVGEPVRPGVCYRLGGAGDDGQGWLRFARLMEHLGVDELLGAQTEGAEA